MSRSARSKPANLTIDSKTDVLKAQNGGDISPAQTSPMSLNLAGIDLSSFGGDFTTPLISLPALPQSPPTSPRLEKESSKTFLNSFKTRLASEQDQRAEFPRRRQTKDDDDFRPTSSSVSKIYHLRKNPGSTPELSLVNSAEGDRKASEDAANKLSKEARPALASSPPEDASTAKRKEKGGFRNPLTRTKSIRRDSNTAAKPSKALLEQPPKTAPLNTDWQGTNEMLLKPRGKERRGKSAERAIASESEDNLTLDRSGKEKNRHAFVTGSKNVMNKAKTGGGSLFNRLGKLGRTGSNHEREIPDSDYVMKVINLPLVEQTRVTRISKDLGSCRDKTEFWMPSLPWRCIDYLNLNCESEGLYRVPGSGPQVKHWQRRFDTELDLDLLDEQELYDPNIIGSMLKSWLRDLPTEIMSKGQQQALAEEIAKENPNYQRLGEEAPQKLRDALSELPPFNYYLLFAITCHLSLLLSHKDKNKMDLNNLSICIGPCLDLDRWLFNYLVGDWRRCWQGCYTEKQFLEAEKAYEQGSDYETPAGTEVQHGKRLDSMKAPSFKDEKDSSVPIGKQPPRSLSLPASNQPLKLDKPSPPVPSLAQENMQPDLSLASLPDYSHYVNSGSIPPTPDRKVLALPEMQQRPATAISPESPKVDQLKPQRLSMHGRSQTGLQLPFKLRNE